MSPVDLVPENNPGHQLPLNMRLGEFHSQSGFISKEKNLLPLPGFEFRASPIPQPSRYDYAILFKN